MIDLIDRSERRAGRMEVSTEANEKRRCTSDNIDKYRLLESRLQSYKHHNWPRDMPLTAEELARAGWFYTGAGDHVKCAWCGGRAFNWMAGDSALGEHRRLFPSCEFVSEFISNTFKPLGTTASQRQAATSVDDKYQDRGAVQSHIGTRNRNWRDTEAAKAALNLNFSQTIIQRAAEIIFSRKCKFLSVCA